MENYDVIIAGAGIVGLSTAYKLLEKEPALKICILEKENGTARHQTGHNSGVIHSGIYYRPGSLKSLNCIRGYQMLLDFCSEKEIAFEICGKVIIAAEETELIPLNNLFERGILNGLAGIKKLTAEEIKELEPHAAGIEGLFVPQTGIVDYKIISEKIADHLISKGTVIKFSEEVLNFKIRGANVEVITDKNKYSAEIFNGCAGLYSDKISELAGSKPDFRIIPFRGEYYKLKDSSKYLIKNLIYPVPDPDFPFLGVHFTRRVDGITEAGPNAVLAFKKEGYRKTDFNLSEAMQTFGYIGFHKVIKKFWKTGFYEMYRSVSKKEFVKSLQKLIPAITENDIISGGSGVRAQACDINGNLIDDFLFSESERFINVCNAPSPAATSCFSVGETVAEKIMNKI